MECAVLRRRAIQSRRSARPPPILAAAPCPYAARGKLLFCNYFGWGLGSSGSFLLFLSFLGLFCTSRGDLDDRLIGVGDEREAFWQLDILCIQYVIDMGQGGHINL